MGTAKQTEAVSLVDPAVAARWDKAFAGGSDKSYPSLDLVRLERWYFGHKPGYLLEYAFGCGANLIHLAECGHDIDAVDVSPAAMEMVERKLSARPEIGTRVRLHLLGTETRHLPFAEASFDYVVAISVLSLLATPQRVETLLKEFQRVLKPGGKMIADINSARSDFALQGSHLGGDIYENRGPDGADDPVRCYCPAEPEHFAALLRRHFVIDDLGYTAHRYLGSEIHEFIACVHKP